MPTVEKDVEQVAMPLALSVASPIGVGPSENVTVPTGVPTPEVAETMAVKVMLEPSPCGFGFAASVVVVDTRLVASVIATTTTFWLLGKVTLLTVLVAFRLNEYPYR